MRGASSISSSKPSAETSQWRSSVPIVVPATRASPAVTAIRFVKSRDVRRCSSTTSMPRSAATTGAFT